MKSSLLLVPVLLLAACSGNHGAELSASDNEAELRWLDSVANEAADILAACADSITTDGLFPRSIRTDYSLEQLSTQLGTAPDKFQHAGGMARHPGVEEYHTTVMVGCHDWTSGFFPGSLWYAYELTDRPELRTQAERFTNMLLPVSYKTDTHDLGFMVNCSYGNAYRLAGADSIRPIVVRTADNLIARFDPEKGVIRSWDFGSWNYPVIIDNMMNLELLMNASRISGDSRYSDVAVRHAVTTMANHFRPDFTSYHLVSYNDDGSVESKGTFQGKADSSAWARGQAWGLYGYTEMARETGDTAFLNQAKAIADMIMERNSAPDKIAYWDFDAPALDNTPRDASAAAITASAMLDLSAQLGDSGAPYRSYAIDILHELVSPAYMAPMGTNGGFVLMHSTGMLPSGSEVDTPLNYADYYFMEALSRYRRLLQGEHPVVPNF